MKKKNNLTVIINRIINAAKQYKKNIVGKTFLILYEGNVLEVLFKTENFLHLCGVETTLYARDFYKKAVKGSLKENELKFSKDHPYIFADTKTQYLGDALGLLKNDALVITDIKTSSKAFKVGTTDLKVVLCFDEQLDEAGNPVNEILIPYSLRVESVSDNKYNEIFEVDYVLSKATGLREYSALEFGEARKLKEYLEKHNLFGKIEISGII